MTENTELEASVRLPLPPTHYVATWWYTTSANLVRLRVDVIPIWVIDILRYIRVVLKKIHVDV
jgi:hypothetical protein